MSLIWTRLATRQNVMLLLTLAALGCLPFALRKLVPDAGISLLLPVTLAGAWLAWLLAPLNLKRSWNRTIFLALGPLVIFAVVAHIGSPLLNATTQAARLLPQFVELIRSGTPLDFSPWIASQQEIASRAGALAQRILQWIAGNLSGQAVPDPAARAFMWSLSLWLLAAWAGWQMRSNPANASRLENRVLMAVLPSTTVLAWTLISTSQKSAGLWLHLAAMLFLLGLAHYESLIAGWRRRRMDFSESIWEDILLATSSITIIAIVTSYLAYSISLEDLRERIREWDRQRARSASSEGASNGNGTSSGTSRQVLDRVHAISSGPQLSTDIVMIVATGDLPAVPSAVGLDVPYYYWRTMTYHTYFGSGWTNPIGADLDLPPNQPLLDESVSASGTTAPPGFRAVHQQVNFPSEPTRHMYWTGTLVQADVPIELTWRTAGPGAQPSADLNDLLQTDMIGAVTLAESYSADSLLSIHSENDLRTARAIYPAWVTEGYLRLPDTVPERVLALARDLTATALTPYDRAVAIETYLRQIPYNLDVPGPPTGRDVADYFLFDLQQGYCDYYATTMTVLARAAGLPARFVMGYASGSYNSLDAHYVVTKADAHAWTEIYFPGIGWVEFEPTPSQPAPVRSRSLDIPAFRPGPSAAIDWSGLSSMLARPLALLWRAAAIAALLYGLWIATETARLARYQPSQSIERMYRGLRRMARTVSGRPPRSQTAAEYAAALSAQLAALRGVNRVNAWLLSPADIQVRALTDLYAQSLFSPHVPGQAESRHALRAWTSLRWRLSLLKLLLALRIATPKVIPHA